MDGDERGVGVGADGGVARLAEEERHLAHHVSRLQDRQPHLAARGFLEDLDLAADDDVGPVSVIALGEESGSGFEGNLFDLSLEPREVVVAEPGEQRDGANRLHRFRPSRGTCVRS